MKNYIELMQKVLAEGTYQQNRTGVATYSLPGQMLAFDLRHGFPAVTTKKLAFKSVAAELCGFLRGYSDARDFRKLGTKVWDQNANENDAWLRNPERIGTDDLGRIYGVQWRRWHAYREFYMNRHSLPNEYTAVAIEDNTVIGLKLIDQLADCLKQIVYEPTSRRILFHAWNPAELDRMALPPCHVLYQFHPNVTDRTLSMTLYLRSSDLFLGASYNIASSGLLMSLVGRLTGYDPARLTVFIGDAHVYENHVDAVTEQATRIPHPPPTLEINARVPSYTDTGYLDLSWLDSVSPDDFSLINYQHHPAIKAPMAV